MRAPKTRSTIIASVLAVALAMLPAAEIWAYSVCVDSYAGGCVSSTICNHYDADGSWIGRVTIEYQC